MQESTAPVTDHEMMEVSPERTKVGDAFMERLGSATVTRVESHAGLPLASVQVSVYWVGEDGVTETLPPAPDAETAPTPWSMDAVFALAHAYSSFDDEP